MAKFGKTAPHNGMKRVRSEFAELCRAFGPQALAVLAEAMNDPRTPTAARQRSAQMILAYGYGQPTNTLEVGVSGADSAETDEQKRFRETVENAAKAATAAMGAVVPAISKPDPARDIAAPVASAQDLEVYAPNETTPAEVSAMQPEKIPSSESGLSAGDKTRVVVEAIGFGAALALKDSGTF